MSYTTVDVATRQQFPQVFTTEMYGSALTDLKNILVESAADEDSLSLRLQNIGIDLINMPIIDGVVQRVAEKIDELRYELLYDPFDFSEKPTLCVEPLWDGEWIWSKPRYDEYIHLSKLSPFTGELLAAKPHILAQKICLWIKKFLPATEQVPHVESKELAVITQLGALTLHNPVLAQIKNQAVLHAWQANARAAKFRRDNQQQRKIIKEITREAREGMARTRELLKEEAKLLREERAEHEEKVKESLASMDRDHQTVAATLHARLDVGDQKLKKAEFRLEKAETEVMSLSQRNSQLAQQIYQQQQQLAEMQNNSGGGICAIL